MPLIRYPGSKTKLVPQILSLFPDEMSLPIWMGSSGWEYREPFLGSGAVGFTILESLPGRNRVWLNDIDYGVASLWKTVCDLPEKLIEQIWAFKPSPEAFCEFKEKDGDRKVYPAVAGFRKLALHRMSYSGMGYMSGGPLGGMRQDNDRYFVGCRWNPITLEEDVHRLHATLKRFNHLRITCKDYQELFADDDEQAFVYLDPPYYLKGPELYRHSFADADHERLADLLRRTRCKWALSYDDHPRIRELYGWASFKEVNIVYTTSKAKGKRPKNQEVVITKDEVQQRVAV